MEVCRIMLPDDANMSGNVHGGTILKLVEEAGLIVATRHCNRDKNLEKGDVPCMAGLARVERTEFLKPMFIGEVAKVQADLTYASKHSLEVTVTVWAEDVVTGSQRLTNRASLWYVPVLNNGKFEIDVVPPLEYKNPQLEELGRMRYEAQKLARKSKQNQQQQADMDCNPPKVQPSNIVSTGGLEGVPVHSPAYSRSSLIYMVHPSDCNKFNFATGGFTMKTMDTVAGIVAFRHCRTNIVTASVDAVDFHVRVKLGNVLTFTGRIIFTSRRSIEIEVLVDGEDLAEGHSYRACSAFFTFVSLDKQGKPIEVPQLVCQDTDDAQRFEEGKSRYEIKTRKRKQEMVSS